MAKESHDTEGIRQDLKDVAAVFENAVEYRKYDSDMCEAVDLYKREMLEWFSGRPNGSQGMTSVTQEQWYNLYLERKRLAERGLYLQYADYKQVPEAGKDTVSTSCVYNKDGRYLVCETRQRTFVDKCYWRGNRMVGRDSQTSDISYYVMRSHNGAGMYICPNCGAQHSLETLLSGCSYCGSKFDISVYRDKITAVCRNNSIYNSREVKAGSLFGVMLTALFVGAAFLLIPFGGINRYVCPACFGVAALSFIAGTFANRGTNRTTKVKRMMRKKNPDFSIEEFLASLDCKIKAIHFAGKQEEVAPFVTCDITPYLKKYENVVSCDTGYYSLHNYHVDGEYQYVELRREIKLGTDCGSRLRMDGEKISLKLVKKLSGQLKNDVTMYRCPGCGATVSLVDGGKCAYCGGVLNLVDYDWIIEGYEKVSKV